jgi:hypothetical protein
LHAATDAMLTSNFQGDAAGARVASWGAVFADSACHGGPPVSQVVALSVLWWVIGPPMVAWMVMIPSGRTCSSRKVAGALFVVNVSPWLSEAFGLLVREEKPE